MVKALDLRKRPRKRAPIPGGPSKVPGGPRSIPGSPSKRTTARPGYSQLRDLRGRYMSGGTGIAWVGLDVMADNFDEVGEELQEARRRAAEELRARVLTYAIINAPWTDRSWTARKSLQAVVSHDERLERSVVFLGYSAEAPYGVYLETMQGGRFAIVGPTINKFAGEMGGIIKGAV